MAEQPELSLNQTQSAARIWLWVLAAMLSSLIGLAALLWYFRYDFITYKAKQVLANNGLTTKFHILSANSQKAVIGDVSISKNGQLTFSAKRIEFEYDYRQVLKGEFKHINMHKPVFNLTLDENGTIQNAWLGNPSGTTSIVFPKNGIRVEDAFIKLRSPYGRGQINVRGEAQSLTDWNFIYNAPNVKIINGGQSVQVDANGGVAQTEPQKISAFGSLKTHILDAPHLKSASANLDFNFNFDLETPDTLNIKGWANITGDHINTAKYSAKTAKMKMDLETSFFLETKKIGIFLADWNLDFGGMSIKHKAERRRRARILTSYNAVQSAPIAKYFSDILPRKLEHLFESFSLQGRGNLQYTKDGYQIHLDDILKISSQDQTIEISSKAQNTLVYNRHNKLLDFTGDIDWSGAHGLRAMDVVAQGLSGNGFTVSDIRSFSAQIQTKSAWQKLIDGDNFSLSPVDIQLGYMRKNGARFVTLTGELDYDGLIPSGYVRGLRGQGIVNIRTDDRLSNPPRLQIGYEPKGGIHIDDFTNISGWRAKDLYFDIAPSTALIDTHNAQRKFITKLQNVEAQIISPDNLRHLQFAARQMNIDTVLGGFPHIWNFDIANAEIFSEDFPSPGTHIRVPHSRLSIEQSRAGNLSFTSLNPDTYIETANVIADTIDIELNGVPDDFKAVYAAQKLVFKGGGIPILPLEGTARFRQGKLIGEANAYLPVALKEASTPIDISFSSEGGRGLVKIDIPSLLFSPNGLQPQYLVPSLRGKIADVEGFVSAHFEFVFGGGKPIRSYGSTKLIDLDIGTLVGPISGINSQLKFSSIFPLKTEGVQVASLSRFDPGFPLQNGHISFEIIPGGVRIMEANWPITNNNDGVMSMGRVYLEPTLWTFGNVENFANLHIENLDLVTLLSNAGQDKISVTGKLSGVLPAKINGVNVIIDNGKLAVKDGGVIRLKTSAASVANESNEYAGHGLKALENLTYQKLEARINGPLDGSVNVDLVLDGNNPDVLNGQKFLFNIGVEGELANIVSNLSKSLSTQENIKRILEIRKGSNNQP